MARSSRYHRAWWSLVLALSVVIVLVAGSPGRAAAEGPEKWIDVDLTWQWLTAYEGNAIVWNGPISSGRAGWETPTGTYYVQRKVQVEDMAGPDPDLPGGYYYQPAVPAVLYFTGQGHALHGVYWHSAFGTPRSHGCVGAPEWAAWFLYDWAPLGTPIIIHH